MVKNRKIILDTETTGLDFLFKDRIIEIGAVELINNDEIGKKFHYYLNPGININQEATKIHGITNDMVKDKPKFSDIADELLNFIQDSKIVAHNSEFDRSFLNLELYLYKKDILLKNRFIDSLVLAKKLYKGEKNSLDDLCIRFNIDNSVRKNYHGALIDAEILAKVYIQLSNIYNDYYLNKNKILTTLFSNTVSESKNFIYRKYDVSEQELQEHTKFLNNIKNPMWNKF